MALPERMKFGIFLGPFHRVGENPTLAIRRDIELVEWLDQLGYDEAWIGEHHSAGWEIISPPRCSSLRRRRGPNKLNLAPGLSALRFLIPSWWPNAWSNLTT